MATLASKLRILPGTTLLTMHAPADFDRDLGKLPEGVKITPKSPEPDQVHWFVMNRAQLERELSRVMKLVKPGVTVWVYYPKGSSGLQTDLSRDKGWDCLLSEGDRLSWINLISFNDTYSVFGFRAKTEADKKKEAKGKPVREIFHWVDPVKKTVQLPPDFATALRGKKKEAAFFDSLSFTNRKEYLEWIVTAKRPETRKERIKGTLERLGKQWKNPRNM
jgi:hypothetical protein